MDMVDRSNAFFLPALSILTSTVDVLAIAAIAAFLLETNVFRRLAPDTVDESISCLFSVERGKDVCGKMSFDSSAAMTCVETVGDNGKLTWLCA